jgi:hypothetical protein
MENEYKCLQRVQMSNQSDVGVLWNCKMVEEDVLQVHLGWDDAQLGGKEPGCCWES